MTKDKRINVRVDDKTLKRLKRYARKEGLTLSEYLVKQGLNSYK